MNYTIINLKNNEKPNIYMKAFITGGTGFIGSNLARKLISEGNRVGLLFRDESKTWRINDILEKVDLLKGDLTNKESLIKTVQEYKPDFIYHLGAYGTYPSFQKDIEKIISININGILNLVDSAKDIPFINIGSSSEYGEKNCPMNENDKCHPNNIYGKTKLMQTIYCKEHNIPTLRLFSVYGPWEEPTRLIPTLIKTKLNGGEIDLIKSVREYAYIEDIINGILKATEKYNSLKGEIINIGSGHQYSMEEVLRELDKIDSKKIKINWNFQAIQNEPNIWVADISKAEKLLNWKPKISLEEGLKKTYEWWRKWEN